MRNSKLMKALLLPVLCLSALSAASAQAATPAAQVYFQNEMNTNGVLSVSVDGQPVLGGVFADSATAIPVPLSAGQHEVVVTRYAGTAFASEVARGTVSIGGAGTYTLTLDASTDALGFDNGYALALTGGSPVTVD